MRITNDCLQQDTLSVEVNGSCATINEIVSQTPQMDCDELMVCIGPHLVSLNDLIMDVYAYAQTAQEQNQSYFMKVLNSYNMLYEYFNKCCSDLIGRLTRIEKRINGLIVVRQIVIEKPLTTPTINTSRVAQEVAIVKPPVIISEERYVIDQSIKSGYMDAYKRYDKYGNITIDPYVAWLKTDDGFKRKLIPKEVPYAKGTPLANAFIERIKAVYDENKIEFDPTTLKYVSLIPKNSFVIPKLGGRWVVSGNKVIDLNGNDLARFLPITYNKLQDTTILLEKVTKYRIDPLQKPVIGYEPILMSYQVLNKRTGSRTTYEAGINAWVKYV